MIDQNIWVFSGLLNLTIDMYLQSGILRDKTMVVKLIYIPNVDQHNNHICRIIEKDISNTPDKSLYTPLVSILPSVALSTIKKKTHLGEISCVSVCL